MNRVYLRALEPDDYKTSVNWRNDDTITSRLGGVNTSFPMRQSVNGCRMPSTRIKTSGWQYVLLMKISIQEIFILQEQTMSIVKQHRIFLSATMTTGMVVMEPRLCACFSTMLSTIRTSDALRLWYWRATSVPVRCMRNWGISRKEFFASPFIRMVNTRTKSSMPF